MTRARSIARSVACWLVLLAGCNRDLPGKPNLADRPVPADQITDFTALYGTYCAGCHGADGRLGPAPPLNDAIFLTIVPDEKLLGKINAGQAGTPMPAFSLKRGGPLTDAQVRAVAEGIKPKWLAADGDRKEPAKPAGDLPAYTFVPPADGAATTEAIARGQQLFASACAECHGADGAGDGAGRLNDPDFLLLASDQMLRRIIITGRPDLGMPDFATADGRGDDFRPLSSADVDDLVALLASWRGGKTGAVAGGPARGRGLLTETRP